MMMTMMIRGRKVVKEVVGIEGRRGGVHYRISLPLFSLLSFLPSTRKTNKMQEGVTGGIRFARKSFHYSFKNSFLFRRDKNFYVSDFDGERRESNLGKWGRKDMMKRITLYVWKKLFSSVSLEMRREEENSKSLEDHQEKKMIFKDEYD